MHNDARADNDIRSSLELLLSTWEQVVDLGNLDEVCSVLGDTASQIYGCGTEIVLAPATDGKVVGNEVFATGTEEVLAYVRFDSKEYALKQPLDQLFLRLVSWTITHNRLRKSAEKRKQLEDSLTLARRILEESLPMDKLQTECWEVSGCLRPAEHLGGDLFAYAAEGDKLEFLLVDAVGHGLDSALLASECRALWRALHSSRRGLALVVARISALLFANTGPERFIAATFGRCLPNGCLELVRCGQGPPYVLAASSVVLQDQEPDLPLGLFPDQTFRVSKYDLRPGEGLLFTSDGVIDLRNEQGLQFGEEKVCQILAQAPPCSQGVVNRLLEKLDLYRGSRAPDDDICAVALRRLECRA